MKVALQDFQDFRTAAPVGWETSLHIFSEGCGARSKQKFTTQPIVDCALCCVSAANFG